MLGRCAYGGCWCGIHKACSVKEWAAEEQQALALEDVERYFDADDDLESTMAITVAITVAMAAGIGRTGRLTSGSSQIWTGLARTRKDPQA